MAAIVYGGVFLGHKVIFKEESSTVPTIQAATDGTLTLGVQAHSAHPTTVEELLPIIAQQLKTYNEIAPTLWPSGAVTNQSLIIEKIRGNKLWLITPDGNITPIQKDDVAGYGAYRQAYVDGFSFYEGGLYYAIADEDVANVLKWQQYLHLGTHDTILFLSHEAFHSKEQGAKWAMMDDVPNRGRDEFLGYTPARAKRDLLQRQLLTAVSEPGDTRLILDALATYADWKVQFPDDYANSVYFDRIEGTAYYYELISGLYAGYPDQIANKNDIDRALKLLATREDIYVWHGLVAEGYIVGGFASVLLDRYVENWAVQLMADPTATPIEMLYQHFEGETLPSPVQLTQAEIDAVGAEIQEGKDTRPRLFRFLYDILF